MPRIIRWTISHHFRAVRDSAIFNISMIVNQSKAIRRAFISVKEQKLWLGRQLDELQGTHLYRAGIGLGPNQKLRPSHWLLKYPKRNLF